MMLEKKTTKFLEELSSASPVPGGGGASAAVGAFSSALGMMVANLTVGKKKYAEAEEEIKEVRSKLFQIQEELIGLTDKDAEAFAPLSRAYGLPRDSQEQREERERIMEQALYGASVVPMDIMKQILEAMRLLKILGEKGSRLALSDVGVAILFAQAALEGASLNIFTNTKLMKDRKRAELLDGEAEALIRKGRELKDTVYAEVLRAVR